MINKGTLTAKQQKIILQIRETVKKLNILFRHPVAENDGFYTEDQALIMATLKLQEAEKLAIRGISYMKKERLTNP